MTSSPAISPVRLMHSPERSLLQFDRPHLLSAQSSMMHSLDGTVPEEDSLIDRAVTDIVFTAAPLAASGHAAFAAALLGVGGRVPVPSVFAQAWAAVERLWTPRHVVGGRRSHRAPPMSTRGARTAGGTPTAAFFGVDAAGMYSTPLSSPPSGRGGGGGNSGGGGGSGAGRGPSSLANALQRAHAHAAHAARGAVTEALAPLLDLFTPRVAAWHLPWQRSQPWHGAWRVLAVQRLQEALSRHAAGGNATAKQTGRVADEDLVDDAVPNHWWNIHVAAASTNATTPRGVRASQAGATPSSSGSGRQRTPVHAASPAVPGSVAASTTDAGKGTHGSGAAAASRSPAAASTSSTPSRCNRNEPPPEDAFLRLCADRLSATVPSFRNAMGVMTARLLRAADAERHQLLLIATVTDQARHLVLAYEYARWFAVPAVALTATRCMLGTVGTTIGDHVSLLRRAATETRLEPTCAAVAAALTEGLRLVHAIAAPLLSLVGVLLGPRGPSGEAPSAARSAAGVVWYEQPLPRSRHAPTIGRNRAGTTPSISTARALPRAVAEAMWELASVACRQSLLDFLLQVLRSGGESLKYGPRKRGHSGAAVWGTGTSGSTAHGAVGSTSDVAGDKASGGGGGGGGVVLFGADGAASMGVGSATQGPASELDTSSARVYYDIVHNLPYDTIVAHFR